MDCTFYYIYLDSIAIREQIRYDFNQQQLILAKQSSRQLKLYFENLKTQLKNIAWLNSKDIKIGKEALKSFYSEQKEYGLIGVKLVGNNNKHLPMTIGYQDYETLPESDSIIVELQLSKLNKTVLNKDTIIYYNIFINVNSNYRIILSLNTYKLLDRIIGTIRSGKTGYAWVIDRDAIALYHPEKDFVGRNIFSARKEKKPYVNFSQINEIMKDRMLKGKEGVGEYESWWHREVKGKITKLIAFSPIRSDIFGNDKIWSVAVVAPISEVSKVIEQSYTRHLIAEAFIILGLFLFLIIMVTYQKKISASLKERVNVQQEYITSILENSMDGIIFTDKDDRIFVWNKGAERIFGYSSEEMKGKGFNNLVPDGLSAIDELDKVNSFVYAQGYVTNFMAKRKTKDDKIITVNISKTLIKADDGSVIGHSIIFKDETEKQEIEQKIYNTEKLASIGTLAAGVAHEINNPLSVILGYTDLLLESFDNTSQVHKDIKLIDSNANHAKIIVENLLGFARITEGLEDHIDIRHSIENVINIVRNTLFTKRIDLRTEVQNNISLAIGDVREFEQVVFNLINNSVAALREIKNGYILIKSYSKNNLAIIEIIDNGIGISEKYKKRIFDPFFTTKKVGEGTGLGLSLCYGIISKFGGKISFTSKSKDDYPDDKSGTTFIIELNTIN